MVVGLLQHRGGMTTTTTKSKEAETDVPSPDPALRRLDRLVGTWKMKGHPVGSKEDSITGTTTFAWVNGDAGTSFFLQQDMQMDYAGQPIGVVRSLDTTRRPVRFDPGCSRTWLRTPGPTNGTSRTTG